jgi:hypothetical protein
VKEVCHASSPQKSQVLERRGKSQARALDPLKKWLKKIMDTKTDWGTQKSAHQAMRFLDLAQYEMWNMQYWENSRQINLHEHAEKVTI